MFVREKEKKPEAIIGNFLAKSRLLKIIKYINIAKRLKIAV